MEHILLNFKGESSDRLDKLLYRLLLELPEFENVSRSQIQRWIRDGNVTGGGKLRTRPGEVIKSAMEFAVAPDLAVPREIIPYKLPLNIVFEDDYLAVIDKPAGLSVHPGAGNYTETLVNALVHHFGENFILDPANSRPGIVHRLDKDTTGLVVVGKSTEIVGALSRQFSLRTVQRIYLCLALVNPKGSGLIESNDHGIIDAPISRDLNNRIRMAVLPGGRSARSEFFVRDRFIHAALLELKLHSGRTHQIRVHLNHCGSPVIGDPVYGNFDTLPTDLKRAAFSFGRQALHAKLLGFQHPVTKKSLSFSSDPPHDMQALIGLFSKGRDLE